MCDLVTGFVIASAALSAGSKIANHNAQSKAADANKKAAKSAAAMNSAELTRRGVQETIAAAAQANALRRQTMRSRSSLAASVAAAGLAGNTADALDTEMLREQDAATASIEKSLAWNLDALNYGKVSEYAQMKSRIAQVPKPNAFATGLSIAGDIAGGFIQYRGLTQPPVEAVIEPPSRKVPTLPAGARSNNTAAVPTLPGLPLMLPSTK